MAQQVKDLLVVSTAARAAAVAWVQSLAWQPPHALGGAKKKKKERKRLHGGPITPLLLQ